MMRHWFPAFLEDDGGSLDVTSYFVFILFFFILQHLVYNAMWCLYALSRPTRPPFSLFCIHGPVASLLACSPLSFSRRQVVPACIGSPPFSILALLIHFPV